MIAVERQPKPADFDQQVGRPGREWVDEHPDGGRPPSYWTRVIGELADAFHSLCAYSAMYLPNGEVDHFVSLATDRSLAYEWTNYRYSAGWINSAKQDTVVLDPFDVVDGWFEILLPSLQLVLTDRLPPDLQDLAEQTVVRLHLQDDERVLRQRREWLRMYTAGELSLDGLRKKAPLIARAVERLGPGAETP